jgi:plastocyanin
MGRRTAVISLALAGATFAAVPSSLGADGAVTANPNNTFSPSQVTITEGEKVTFRNAGGAHNIHWESDVDAVDGPPRQDAWVVTRTFSTPGVYRYFCDAHGGRGGLDMAGVVVVNRRPDPPRSERPSRPTPPPRNFSAVALREAFTGTAFRLRLAAPKAGTVRGSIRRRNKAGEFVKLGNVLIRVPAALSSVRISRTAEGKRLNFGTYRVRLLLNGESDTVNFKLRP